MKSGVCESTENCKVAALCLELALHSRYTGKQRLEKDLDSAIPISGLIYYL